MRTKRDLVDRDVVLPDGLAADNARGEAADPSEEAAVETPHDFYARILRREDIRQILTRLAR
jgi:hypothetical protein